MTNRAICSKTLALQGSQPSFQMSSDGELALQYWQLTQTLTLMTPMIYHLLQRLRAYLAPDVPADIAACEFDCRVLNCDAQTWQRCPRRLAQMGNSASSAEPER